MYDWDEAKNQRNIAKHGVGLRSVFRFDWSTATTRQDTRGDYGEMRLISEGLVDGRLFVLVHTMRDGTVRVISLRKANARERRRHGNTKKLH